jgi:hypothetical protein
MAQARKKFSWPVSRHSLVSLLGAEYRLMQEAGGDVLKKFYWSAVLILFIMVVSMCSIFYAVDLLIHNHAVEILLSVFISMLFILMYVFLLNTFTKENLSTRNRLMSLSNISRIGFVVFMGFIISKPIEIYLLQAKMAKRVVQHRAQLYQSHLKHVDGVYQAEINKLRQDSIQQHANLLVFATPTLQNDMQVVTEKIQRLDAERTQAIDRSAQKINASAFFIFQVQEASRSWLAWACCLLITGLFILPGYIIYAMSGDNEYFKKKKEQERNLVTSEFTLFRKKYTSLFDEKFHLEKEWFSVYTDPPFNTTKPAKPAAKTQQLFFEKYLKDKT